MKKTVDLYREINGKTAAVYKDTNLALRLYGSGFGVLAMEVRPLGLRIFVSFAGG